MDIQSLLLQINQKLDLLLKAHNIDQDTAHNEALESDIELGRELARSITRIRSDEGN